MVIYLDELDHDGERQGSHPHVGCRMIAIFQVGEFSNELLLNSAKYMKNTGDAK